MLIIGFSFALLASADVPGIPASHVPGRLCAGSRDGDGGGRACNLITNGLETGIVWDLCTMGAADQHATACCLGSCQFTWDPSIHIPTFPAADVLQSVRLRGAGDSV